MPGLSNALPWDRRGSETEKPGGEAGFYRTNTGLADVLPAFFVAID